MTKTAMHCDRYQHYDQLTATNFQDENGNHFGGCSYGPGFTISWQRGPLVDSETLQSRQNGAFTSTILHALIHQMEYVNQGRFQCEENEEAIKHLKLAQEALGKRRRDRTQRGVSGTHQP